MIETVEIWPDNERAVSLFLKLQTQWRASAVGLIGLDYAVLYRALDDMKLPKAQRDDLFSDVQVIEFAALDVMREKA